VIQTRIGESRFDVMTRQLQAQHPLNGQPGLATPSPPTSVALLRPALSSPAPVSISAPPVLPQPSQTALEQSRARINNMLLQMAQQRQQQAAAQPTPPNIATTTPPPAVETAYAPHLHGTPPQPAVTAPRGQVRNLQGAATVYYQGDADKSGAQTSVGLRMRDIEGKGRFQNGLPVVAALTGARNRGINAGDVLLIEVNGAMQGVYVGDIGTGGRPIRGQERLLDLTPTVFQNTGITDIYANPDVKILEEFGGQRTYIGTDASPRNAARQERLLTALNDLATANATRDEAQIREAAARVAQVQQEIS